MEKHVIKQKVYFFIIGNLVIFTLSVFGQGNSHKLNQVISINKSKIRVDSLLNTFSRQTQMDFSFNSKRINPAKIILVKNKSKTLSQWLSTLQHDINIHYTLLGDHIILVDNPPLIQQKPLSRKVDVGRNINQPAISRIAVKPESNNSSSSIPIYRNPEQKPFRGIDESQTNNSNTEAARDTASLSATRAYDPVPTRDSIQIKASQVHDSSVAAIGDKDAIKGPSKSSRKRQTIFESNKKILTGVGLVISRPATFSKGEKSSATGVGFDINLERLFSKHVSGTIGLGYNYFIGNYTYYNYVGTTTGYVVGRNFAVLPILGGVKYYWTGQLYVSAEAGMVIKASSNTGSHLALSPSAGYILPLGKTYIDAGIKLTYVKAGFGLPESTSLQNGGYSFLSLRIAFLF